MILLPTEAFQPFQLLRDTYLFSVLIALTTCVNRAVSDVHMPWHTVPNKVPDLVAFPRLRPSPLPSLIVNIVAYHHSSLRTLSQGIVSMLLIILRTFMNLVVACSARKSTKKNFAGWVFQGCWSDMNR